MSTAIGGGLVFSLLLVIVVLLQTTFFDASASQAAAIGQAWDAQYQGLHEEISITSISASDSGNGTDVTAQVVNTGEEGIARFNEMDVLVDYIEPQGGGTRVVARLTYVSGSPGDQQWTVEGMTPDILHPGMWDPDETATITLRLVPPVKSSTYATVAIVLPRGASDSAYFTR